MCLMAATTCSAQSSMQEQVEKALAEKTELCGEKDVQIGAVLEEGERLSEPSTSTSLSKSNFWHPSETKGYARTSLTFRKNREASSGNSANVRLSMPSGSRSVT